MPGLAPYKRKLNANQRATINARGTTVFLRKAQGELSVTLRSNAVGTKTGASYTLRMEQAEKWFHAEEFDSVILEDESGNANEIELYIGYGDFEKPVPDIVNVQVTSAESEAVSTEADETNIDVGNAGKVYLRHCRPQHREGCARRIVGYCALNLGFSSGDYLHRPCSPVVLLPVAWVANPYTGASLYSVGGPGVPI